MLARRRPEAVDEAWCIRDERLHRRCLAVQDAQRVRVQPPARVLVEIGRVALEMLDQGDAMCAALLGIADGIDRQANPVVEAQLAPQPREQDHLLGIDVRTRKAERFDVELVELAVTAFLRSLVPEHRPGEPHALRSLVSQVVLDRGADNARGGFGTKRQAFGGQLVLERVHLLLDDVGRLADRADEQRRRLDDRHAQVPIAVEREHATDRVLEALPECGLVRQHVVHAAYRLQLCRLAPGREFASPRLQTARSHRFFAAHRHYARLFTEIVRRSGSSCAVRASPPQVART